MKLERSKEKVTGADFQFLTLVSGIGMFRRLVFGIRMSRKLVQV